MRREVEIREGEESWVTAWMQRLAALPLDAPPLPEPGVLWWKAELLERRGERQKALARLELGERVMVGLGIAGAMLLLLWLWPRLPASAGTLVLVACGSLIAATAVAAVALMAEK
jgi:hypothetical protein